MSDNFKPYEKEDEYKVVLTKDEALLIQRLRKAQWGSITVHLVNGKIVRIETISSELVQDTKNENISIAMEIIKG